MLKSTNSEVRFRYEADVLIYRQEANTDQEYPA